MGAYLVLKGHLNDKGVNFKDDPFCYLVVNLCMVIMMDVVLLVVIIRAYFVIDVIIIIIVAIAIVVAIGKDSYFCYMGHLDLDLQDHLFLLQVMPY